MRKFKFTILSTYPVLPKKHGGQLRVFNLYQKMSKQFNITIVSLNDNEKYSDDREGNIREISIPKSRLHKKLERRVQKNLVNISVGDIILEKFITYTPMYEKVASVHMHKSQVIVCAQPYLFHLMEKYRGKKKLIYDSQNVEYILKQQILQDIKAHKKLLDDVYRLEDRALRMSDAILTCSHEDSKYFNQLYNIGYEKMILTPNGVDTELNVFKEYKIRQQKKKELGLDNNIIVVFIGSMHKPNIEAVEEIIKMANILPNIQFIVIGRVNVSFRNVKTPKNITFTGLVEEEEKQSIYTVSDLAINPMKTGSGTNLKISEYMANGLPVISTKVGARGYQFKDGTDIIISPLEEFSEKIMKLCVDKILQQSLSRNGRKIVEQMYSWEKIAEKCIKQLQRFL